MSLACVEHGAAGHADGAAVATHDVIAVKAHAGSGKAVDNRGFDVRVAVGADGVGALVVGEDEEYVGLR
jgi:hypothetical protein